MTTVELAIRLCRDLQVGSLQQLSSDGRLDMVTAINAALQRHHALSPDHLKVQKISAPLRKPESIDIGVTNGSKTYSGWTPGEDQLFNSIRISTDETVDHWATGDVDLLDTYMGQTGTQKATIYGDVVSFKQPIERIVSEPVLDIDGCYLRYTENNNHWEGIYGRRQRIGRPKYYRLEKQTVNRGSDTMFYIRVDTLPDQDYRIRFDVQLSPKKVTYNDLVTPVNLPIRDDHVESVLLPLARAEMTCSKLWEDPKYIPMAKEKAEKAERVYEQLTVHHPAPKYNQVGTPNNW